MIPRANPSTYILAQAGGGVSSREAARIEAQDVLLIEAIGLLPDRTAEEMAAVRRVLDIGCGPGSWLRRVVVAYPHLRAVGIDISAEMLSFAHAWTQPLGSAVSDRLTYQVADARAGRLPFLESSFDLVNARFMQTFLYAGDWLPVLLECARLLAPGGILRLVEAVLPQSNSAALSRFFDLLALRFASDDRLIVPAAYLFLEEEEEEEGEGEGEQSEQKPRQPVLLTLLSALARLMGQAGFVEGCAQVFEIDCGASASPSARNAFQQDYSLAIEGLTPFLVQNQVLREAEVQQLTREAVAEIASPDFACTWPVLLLSARTPR